MKRFKQLLNEDDFTKTPFARGNQTLEIVVEPSGGAFRAMIKTVNGKPYGSNPIHPKEFLASGKTAADALLALAQKLK